MYKKIQLYNMDCRFYQQSTNSMSGTYQRVSAVLTDVEGIEGCSSVVQHLPSMYEAQVLIPSTPKKKKTFQNKGKYSPIELPV